MKWRERQTWKWEQWYQSNRPKLTTNYKANIKQLPLLKALQKEVPQLTTQSSAECESFESTSQHMYWGDKPAHLSLQEYELTAVKNRTKSQKINHFIKISIRLPFQIDTGKSMHASVLFSVMIITSLHLQTKGFITKPPCKSNIWWGFVTLFVFKLHSIQNYFLTLKYSFGQRTDHKLPYEMFCKLEISSVIWKEASTTRTRLGRK